MKCSLSISNFLEAITSLSYSTLFLYFLAFIIKECFLISPCYSWNTAFRCVYLSFSPLPFTSLLFSAICKAFSENHFAFLNFFLGLVLITSSCTMLQISIQSSSGTLSVRSNPLNLLSLPLYNCKGFDLGHT